MSDPPPPPPPPPDNLTPPPGYVGYGAAPTPLSRVRPIRGLSRALTILVGISGVVSAIGGLLTPAAVDKADDFVDGRISEDDFLQSYAPLSLTLILTLATTIAACVLTMIWMYRISANVRAYGRSTFWAPLFAVFGWLLPPLLFVIPLLMLRELWKASTPEGINDPVGWKRQPENPALLAWWVLFGLLPLVIVVLQPDTLFGGGGVANTTTESLAEGLQDTGTLSVVAGFVQLFAAVAWIMFVRQMARRHTSLTSES